ncbi:hypothetical protein [Chryseosolibacter indicus]|uniref:Uncharacterized protein n=1 Tax=Chryseosolibacter indicus TaxID=2782351 RepID=A0ABS5VQV2_9BACT|nr:hypothetical protein [Chryseosolibacter indicus]MBT1703830.1 hypothetical protein [Chryseosolibacter indicus]
MENNIKLSNSIYTNSYLALFQIALSNFSLAVQENPDIKKRFRRKYSQKKQWQNQKPMR